MSHLFFVFELALQQ